MTDTLPGSVASALRDPISRQSMVPDWDPAVLFEVYDEPIPQGSMKAITINGYARLVSDNPRTKKWREKVKYAAMQAQGRYWHAEPGAVVVAVEFYMPKPKSRPKRRRTLPTTKPDIDKLARAVCDALTAAGTYEDDARIVDLHTRVRYAAPDAALALPWEPVIPAARIAVWGVDEEHTWLDAPLVPWRSVTSPTTPPEDGSALGATGRA